VKNLFYLNKYFSKYKWHLILGTLFVTLSNYFATKIPQTIRDAINYILEVVKQTKDSIDGSGMIDDGLTRSLLIFGGTVIGLALLKGVFMYFMRQTIIVMSRLIEYDIRKEVFAKYEDLDQSFFRKNKTGDLMARITEDVSKVRMYLGPALLYGINLTTLFVLVIYAMFQVNYTLAMYTLFPLPFLSLSIYLVSSMINKKSELIAQQLSTLNSISQEVYSGIRVIKSYAKEKQFGKYFLQESNDFKKKSLNLANVNALFYPLMILLVSTSTLITVVVGGIQVSKGNITPGNIAEFVIYVNMLTWPVTAIGWVASIIQQAEASQKRINEFLFTENKLAVAVNPVTHAIEGNVTFENVTFVYPDTGIKALDNVSFEIKAGQKIAILGRTAAGKTTIADLILRMYDATTGRILIDGIDIKTLNIDELRERIGYVPQDVFLFSDTIAKNVAFGKPDASIEEIKKYTEYASVYEDINNLPEQFETLVGERGVTLSGGQKQRISIARAFIKKPDLIILDDSLSAVDTNTEQQILNYFNTALAGKTAIIITHRIYNMLDFDNILFIENGQIIEQGTHSELISLDGAYNNLINQQSESSIVDL